MNRIALAMSMLMLGTPALAQDSDNKRQAVVWYEAFSKHDPELLGSVLADDWYETPSAERGGKQVGMKLLVSLTTVFPDFDIEIQDMVQEGNKVVVRSHITGTQSAPFMGLRAQHKKISIQAIDIHEFKDGKIIHTWHSEDWMTGLRQLGVFDALYSGD